MSKDKLTPELRFPEFVNEEGWEVDEIGILFKFKQGVQVPVQNQHPTLEKGMVRFIRIIDITSNTEAPRYIENPGEDHIIKKNDLFMIRYGTPGLISIGFKGVIANNLFRLIWNIDKHFEATFWFYSFQLLEKTICSLSGSSSMPAISFSTLDKLEINFPKNPKEQQKIASCLSSLDELLAAHNDKLTALKDHKKGLMQNLFPQVGETVPKVRFKEFEGDGEWVEKKLGKLSKRVLSKNKDGKITAVFTNSAIDGIVDQRDYFDKDIANQKNLENYYVVEDGDYIYNPRISVHAPVGPLSKNRLGKTGVMSPLYTVFRFNEKRNDFYEYYFQTPHWHRAIREVSNTGARYDRMSITASSFMEINVLHTSPYEQQKIASCLSAVDELIAAQADKIEQLQQHKKGLMQGLFPKIES